MAPRTNDSTIHETFDILNVPEEARNDATLFVMMDAFMKTPEGWHAAKASGFLPFFKECTTDYDEREMGPWPARDYAMRVTARHIGPIQGTKRMIDHPKKPLTKSRRNGKPTRTKR